MPPYVIQYPGGRLRTNPEYQFPEDYKYTKLWVWLAERVLQEGRGLYCPNELASVEVNVMGKYCTSDDDGGTHAGNV